MSFPQFFLWKSPVRSFLRAVKYCSLGLLRIPLGRSLRISYGYTGEDRLIESLLKTRITYNGFYVDVGCNDPRFISNTFLLYRRGWRGVCIDANEKLIQKFKKVRPRDKAVCALISNDEHPREFYELTNNGLSTTEPAFIDGYLREGQKIVAKRILQPRTLTAILDEYQSPLVFDLLSVDAEEHDLQVIKSLDLTKYSPRLIIIEAEDFSPDNPTLHPIYQYLVARGYGLSGYILKNLFFMKKTQ